MDDSHDDVPDDHHICHCSCPCGSRPGIGARARPVRAGFAQLLDQLEQLHRATFVTGNQAAALTHLGSLEAATRVGTAFPVRSGSATLRVDPTRLTGAAVGDTTAPRSGGLLLSLLGPEGTPVHQVRADTGDDRRLLDGLDLLEAVPTPVVDSGESWTDGDQLVQLDVLLAGRARQRRDLLSAVPSLAVRSVAPGLLPAVLEHLGSVALPLAVTVTASGVMQTVPGKILSVQQQRGRVWAILRSSVLDLDLRQIAECLVVRVHGAHGPTSQLEIYDLRGRCAAVFTQIGLVGEGVHHAWEHLAASLPAAS